MDPDVLAVGLPGEDEDVRSRHGGELADTIDQIRRDREARYAKLAQRYRASMEKAIGGPISGPDAARRALASLGIDVKQLRDFVAKIAAASARTTKGQLTSDALEDRVSQGVASLSDRGRNTLSAATAGLRRERWFADALDSGRYLLMPDPTACGRYEGFTEYGSSRVPGAQRATSLVAIVHLCASRIESGDVARLQGLLAHELSHGLHKEVAGESTAELVTQPVLTEIAAQLAQAPEFKGQETAIRQYLFEKRGGYPQAELFAVLQAVPHDPRLLKNDLLLVTLVCELRRMDAARLPETVRDQLIEDLKFRTTFFYEQRIRESEGSQARSLEVTRQIAALTLEQALALREVERTERSNPLGINCQL